jgi:hypothetical protein
LSCNSELTKNKAETIVTEKYHFPITENEAIKVGILSSEADSLPGYYYVLQRQGLFQIEHMGEKSTDIFGTFHQFDIRLTEKSKEYLVNNPLTISPNTEAIKVKFKTCKVNFKGIKEVITNSDKNKAEITFIVQRSDFTPFWNFYLDPKNKMLDTIQTRTLLATKTKDGWKSAK